MSIKKIFITFDKSTDIADLIKLAASGADGLVMWDEGATRADIEPNAALLKNFTDNLDIPIDAFGGVGRFEDVKKLLYGGAQRVIVDTSTEAGEKAYDEAFKRFGKDKVITLTEYSPRFADAVAEAAAAQGLQ